MSICGNKIPVLCNQENFLLKGNSYKVNQALPNCHIIFKGGKKQSLDRGGPSNGMFIAIPDRFNGSILDVSPDHWRLQAVILKCENSNLLAINSYFPTDPATIRCNEAELEEIFVTIEEVLNNNDISSLLWCGDINSDFLRNSGHVRAVRNFVERMNLQIAWNKFDIDFTHVHEVNEVCSVAIIDHFFWSDSLDSSVTEAGVIHSIENSSDHSPIYCVIDSQNLKQNETKLSSSVPKPSWKKASEDEKGFFRETLSSKLSKISIPDTVIECQNVQCNHADHRDTIDDYTEAVLEVIDDTAFDCLPVPSDNNSDSKIRRIPGWNEEVKPFKEMSKFWAAIWESAGKPLNNIMKKSKNVYHYQFKKCVKAGEKIKRSKLLGCLDGEEDIFQEIKKIRNVKQTVASVIDGKSKNVESHFSDIYKSLYNSVNDKQEVLEILKNVHDTIDEDDLKDVLKVTPEKVKEATDHLNNNKTDPVYDFSSDCLKNGPEILYIHLSWILKSFLIHSHVSLHLLLAILVPIVKDKLGDISSSKNYRSIAISSLILKIFDWLVILLFGTTLSLDSLQFSYQAGCSASMCSWLAVETIDYFVRNGGEVFTCQADKTKAFDLVQHSILFRKLIEKKLSRIFLRLLIVMYLLQSTC